MKIDGGKETRSTFCQTMYQELEQEAKAVCKQLVITCLQVSCPFIHDGAKPRPQLAYIKEDTVQSNKILKTISSALFGSSLV